MFIFVIRPIIGTLISIFRRRCNALSQPDTTQQIKENKLTYSLYVIKYTLERLKFCNVLKRTFLKLLKYAISNMTTRLWLDIGQIRLDP